MNETPLTKEKAIALYEGNRAALARALGLTRQAISKLPDGPLPEWMDLKIRFVLKPEAFMKKPAPQDQERAA